MVLGLAGNVLYNNRLVFKTILCSTGSRCRFLRMGFYVVVFGMLERPYYSESFEAFEHLILVYHCTGN